MEVGTAVCEGYQLGEGVGAFWTADEGCMADLLGYWGGGGEGEAAGRGR